MLARGRIRFQIAWFPVPCSWWCVTPSDRYISPSIHVQCVLRTLYMYVPLQAAAAGVAGFQHPPLPGRSTECARNKATPLRCGTWARQATVHRSPTRSLLRSHFNCGRPASHHPLTRSSISPATRCSPSPIVPPPRWATSAACPTRAPPRSILETRIDVRLPFLHFLFLFFLARLPGPAVSAVARWCSVREMWFAADSSRPPARPRVRVCVCVCVCVLLLLA